MLHKELELLPFVTSSPLFKSDNKAEWLSAGRLEAMITGTAAGGGGGGGAGPTTAEGVAILPSTFQVRPVVWKSVT